MEGVVRSVRRAAMLVMAFGSAGFGVLMIWILVRPGVIAGVATVEMMVVLGLFLLPAVTLAAWFMDHRAIAEMPAGACSEGAPNAADGATREPGHACATPRHSHTEREESSPRHLAGVKRHRRVLVGVGGEGVSDAAAR